MPTAKIGLDTRGREWFFDVVHLSQVDFEGLWRGRVRERRGLGRHRSVRRRRDPGG